MLAGGRQPAQENACRLWRASQGRSCLSIRRNGSGRSEHCADGCQRTGCLVSIGPGFLSRTPTDGASIQMYYSLCFIHREGKSMKQTAWVLKGRRVYAPTNAQLLHRLIALQKLRERVRLAEVAMKLRSNTALARHPQNQAATDTNRPSEGGSRINPQPRYSA